jgi:hypothetical protein
MLGIKLIDMDFIDRILYVIIAIGLAGGAFALMVMFFLGLVLMFAAPSPPDWYTSAAIFIASAQACGIAALFLRIFMFKSNG